MNELKVLTVCGAGVGTSTLLRMNINETIKSFNIGIPFKVENTSLTRAKGTRCDLIVTFASFEADARKLCDDVIVINNLMDKQELKQQIGEFLKKKQII
jgi:PTS system ascorbate-specific IIB component